MGNCSTQQHHISVPQQPTIVETEFIKPEPPAFSIPVEVSQTCEVTSNQGPEAKMTNLPTNPKFEPIELAQLNNLKPGTLFIDTTFKADKKGVGQKIIIDHLQWKRPSQFLRQEPIVFQGEIQEYQFKQGRLENSYLVSSFSLLGHSQQLFTQILSNIFGSRIEQINPSKSGGYALSVFVQGWWKKVVIDDQFPTSYGNCLLSNYRNQLWIWIIEKVYAKIFKSFQNIQRGLLGPFMTFLTGAPYQYLNTKSSELISPDFAWKFVKQNMDNGYLLCISTETCDRNKYFQRQATFSYTVLDCQEVYILTTTKKKRQRILKLNNPWGRYEWKGRWSEYSDVWSEELRHQLDYQKADDSVMWINIEDLLKNFGQICSVKYKPQFINTSLKLKYKEESTNQLKGIFIYASHRTEGFLSLIQPDHRHFGKSYNYSMSKLILLQMDKETQKPKSVITQKIDFDHYCSFPIQLNPGLYYLIIEMDWTCSFARETVLNIYADKPINLRQDDKMPSGEQLFYELVGLEEALGKVLEVYHYPHDPNIKRITGVFGGYVYYHYFNQSKDNKYLSETVKLGNSKNLAVVGQNSPNQFAVKLLPGQQKLVKMKITKEGNGQYSFNPLVKNQVFQKFSAQILLEMLKKKPTKSRQRDIENEPIQVYIKTFEYSGGVALLYCNQMSKYSFIEQIIFEIANLRLENEHLEQGDKFNIELQPHEQKMLSFVMVDPSKPYSFKTKVQYYLGTPQFKF